MKRLVGLLMLLCNPALAKTYTVLLGNTPVTIVQETTPKKSATKGATTLVHFHENETTALSAAKKYIHKKGGTVITLRHGGSRNIVFRIHHVRYEVDPNRIFTDKGIQLSLKQFGHYSKSAHQQVKALATRIVALIPAGKVIAVHNNRHYSLKEYFPHRPMHHNAKAVHYLQHSNIRNFYFVTDPHEYQRLKTLRFNVALQAPRAQDDGSLSYYLGKSNYINIEAGYGELKAQLGMLYHA
jgi:hypothetical protein